MFKFLIFLLLMLLLLINLKHNKEKQQDISQYQELLYIKVRHLALQNFRSYINDIINDIDRNEIKEILIIKILSEDDSFKYEDVEPIVDSFIVKLFETTKL